MKPTEPTNALALATVRCNKGLIYSTYKVKAAVLQRLYVFYIYATMPIDCFTLNFR